MMYKISAEIQNIKGQITYSSKHLRKKIFYTIQLILVIIYAALEICTYAVDWWTIGNSNNLHATMCAALFTIYLGTLVYTNQKIKLLGVNSLKEEERALFRQFYLFGASYVLDAIFSFSINHL